jgi:hypothetical protein
MPDESKSRPRREPAKRTPDRVSDRPVKTAVYLSEDASLRLRAACLVERTTQSIMIERLIAEHLSGYYVGYRASKAGGTEAVA